MPSYEIYTHHIAYRMRIENLEHFKTRNEQYGVYRFVYHWGGWALEM